MSADRRERNSDQSSPINRPNGKLIIGLLAITVTALVWAVATGQFVSRDQRMKRRFDRIQRYLQPGELQVWATNLLATRPKGMVPVPDFVWRGHSDAQPFGFVPYGEKVSNTYTSTVWLGFSDTSDSWYLLVGHPNFTLPLTNPTNRNYCVRWVPGVYFCYER